MTVPSLLFAPPSEDMRRGLDALHDALNAVLPLNTARRGDLPRACRDLSALLTSERSGLESPYWSSPRLASAYLRYFLPWNMVRLLALLPTLPLAAPSAGTTPLLLDLGSGPLTLPLALWLARPDLRALPVTVLASDTVGRPLNLGRDIFEHVRARMDPASPWRLQTLRAPLHEAPRRVKAAWLVSLGNVLNEVESRTPALLLHRLPALVAAFARTLVPGGFLLAVEPGNRQGGRLIALLRQKALLCDFQPLSPCPHAGPCSLGQARASAWCHFNAPIPFAPFALRELSRQAGLDKDSISLSFLLLRRNQSLTTSAHAESHALLSARIISDAFVLPGHVGRARYACTSRGLALIPDAARLPSGACCPVLPTAARDAKSRAFIAKPAEKRPTAKSADGHSGKTPLNGKTGDFGKR